MTKIVLVLFSVFALCTQTAQAYDHRRGGGHNGGGSHYNHNDHNRYRGSDLAAALIGGAVVGGLIYNATPRYSPPPPVYYAPPPVYYAPPPPVYYAPEPVYTPTPSSAYPLIESTPIELAPYYPDRSTAVVGEQFDTLPYGHVRQTINGRTYYLYQGVYYRRDPNSGYVVVPVPSR